MGAMKSAAKVYTSQGSNGSKGEYKCQHKRQRLTGETQKGKMVSALQAPGHVAVKYITDMPQEVKDLIISSAAHVMREDKLDESDDDMAETITFARENPHMFTLMANTLQPTCDHKDEMDVAQTLTEFAHIASDIQ